jgi:3-keto-L-gulonate-6-phosphate decarboxylase
MPLDIPQPILQIALDYKKLLEAVETAEMAREELEGLPWLCEAGTPLIKNEGSYSVIPTLRNVVGKETKIIADMKTISEPGEYGADLEVEVAAEAGADVTAITFLGGSKRFWIDLENATKAAKKHGIGLMIEHPEHVPYEPNSLRKIDEIAGDIAYLEYHIPIDVQKGVKDFSKVREISRLGLRMGIGAAGGLNEETIPTVREYGAGIIVVGSGITNPKVGTPRDAIRTIRNVIYK